MQNNIYTITKHLKIIASQDNQGYFPVAVCGTSETMNVSAGLFPTFISADIYNEVIQINKTSKYLENGNIEEIGLNDIFKNLGDEVFTVFFSKASKLKTKKQVQEEKEAQRAILKQKIEASIQTSTLGEVADKIIKTCEENMQPIEETISGDPRKLRGIKLTKFSSDGMYDVLDFDQVDDGKPNYNQRKVNLQNIMALISSGKLYIRKDLKLTEEKLLKLF
jgi:hypothetical protein